MKALGQNEAVKGPLETWWPISATLTVEAAALESTDERLITDPSIQILCTCEQESVEQEKKFSLCLRQ